MSYENEFKKVLNTLKNKFLGFVESRSGAVEVGSAVTVSDPFGVSVSEYLTMSSVSRSRSSNRMCDFLTSGFRTRDAALLHTVKPGFAFAQAVKRHLLLSATRRSPACSGSNPT
jgi:hypothetical protein